MNFFMIASMPDRKMKCSRTRSKCKKIFCSAAKNVSSSRRRAGRRRNVKPRLSKSARRFAGDRSQLVHRNMHSERIASSDLGLRLFLAFLFRRHSGRAPSRPPDHKLDNLPRAHSLQELKRENKFLGLTVFDLDRRVNSAAYIEVADHAQFPRPAGLHEIVQDPIDDGLVESALVAIGPEIKL